MKLKQFFIKMENITTPLKSYQVLTFPKGDNPITVKELLEKIHEHYGFIKNEVNAENGVTIRLELWTGPIGSKRIRLDLCKDIPDKYDTIWVRGYVEIYNNVDVYNNTVELIYNCEKQ